MRELEFLPDWYPRLQRRRRMVRLQIWMTLVLVVGLALWTGLVDRNRRAATAALTSIRGQLQQSDAQVKEVDRLSSLRQQYRQQEQLLARFGTNVEGTRLIHKIAEVMPPSVALTSLNFDVEETQAALSAVARAALKNANDAPMEKRLKVKVQGVAPTDADLAAYITELNKVSYFERVSLSYARDKCDGGYTMREFEMTFSINLTPTAVAGGN